MKNTLFNHTIIRILLGLIPIVLFALIIFSDKQSGNDFLGINFVKVILGFGSLFLWGAWIIIETIVLFFKKQNYFAYTNIILIIIIGAIYTLELYLNHIL
ncbi:hypothetical protein [Niabella ginsengisoli]|uniref:Uncharacterized protein n=1 Tax=Niabella ginsengisoli TaxID=522298 RepID=A0ABS9SJY5_9BACT|nr:hypothetical protein [Niabella ginsengisoli]MCH5598664.1 hypothetical protein [Niabella ginsengisoli]